MQIPMFASPFEVPQSNNNSTGWKPPLRITQGELAEYSTLKQQEKDLKQQLSAKRDSLLQRLEANAEIEPGRFNCELKLQQVRTFSYEKIANLVGQESADNLRNELEPTIQKKVVVGESGQGFAS